MRWSKVTARPTDGRLREFAAVAICIMVAITLVQFLRGQQAIAAVCFILAVSLALVSWRFPRVLAPVFTLSLLLTFPLAWLLSHILLAILFFGLITPLAIVFRLCGRDVLDRRSRKDQATSYWQPRSPAKSVRRYFRQY